MKDRYLNPFTDFGFKKLFGSEPNKDLLLDFLNELIRERGTIQSLTYLKNDQLGSTDVDRRAVFDLYCESETGEKFIVELQKAKQKFFKDRSVFYSTFPIQEQAQRGEWDFQLNAVYTIGILDFVFDEDKDSPEYFHHHVQLMETKRKKVFYDKLTYIYLEMPKFTKTEKELETHFDKWLYVIKNLSTLTERPKRIQERIFKRLFKVAEIAKFDPAERQAYEDSLKYYRDLKNVMQTQREEGQEEEHRRMSKILKEKEQALNENAKALEQKDKALEQKDKALEQKDKALEEKDRLIQDLQRKLKEKLKEKQ